MNYASSQKAWEGYDTFLRTLIKSSGARSVLELGGGANPALSLDEVREFGLDYTVLDISQSELDKAPAGYHKRQADVGTPLSDAPACYDLVFSKMLAEHLGDGRVFHENVLKLLRPGGIAFHFFPTLYAPPFLANRLLPEHLGGWILQMVSPRDRYRNAKFPAYYHWCRGPTGTQLGRFVEMGYEIERYTGFFGHEAYYARIPLLRRWHQWIVTLLLRYPIPGLSSFAYVVLRKCSSALSHQGNFTKA